MRALVSAVSLAALAAACSPSEEAAAPGEDPTNAAQIGQADPETQAVAAAPPPQIPEDAEVDAPDAPYDERADATAAVGAAFDRAEASGKRVAVIFGANWCPDCRILSGMMNLPTFEAFLDAHYELVKVNVGRYDRNQDLVQRFGFAQGLEGVPTVVITTAEGAVINAGTAAEWRTAREREPQEALDYFHRFAFERPAEDARQVAVNAG